MSDIEPSELKQRQDQGEKLVIIDVREAWEYDEVNIGATNIPLHNLPTKLAEMEDWKDQEIVLHCKSGARSRQAQKFLVKNGFTKTRNLIGGIEGYLSTT